jgi:hypothetical protein
MSQQSEDTALKESEFQNGRLYRAVGNLGLSLFAGQQIPKNEVILTFEGKIIGFGEAVAKGDYECWPLQFDHDKYIDLEMPGCLANHSCEPNAGIRDTGNEFCITLIALRDISQDEEIRYDYSTTMDEDFFTMPCRCGSITCRGVVEDFRRLPSDVRESYLESGLVMKFIAGKKVDVEQTLRREPAPEQGPQLSPLLDECIVQ